MNRHSTTVAIAFVMSKDRKPLNIDELDQSLWLVKVPAFVAQKWETCQNDEILGNLGIQLRRGANNAVTKEILVNLKNSTDNSSNSNGSNRNSSNGTAKTSGGNNSTASNGNTSNSNDIHIPTEFKLEETSKGSGDVSFLAFSYDSTNGNYVVDGTCTRKLFLKPQPTKEYYNYIAERKKKSMTRFETTAVETNTIFSSTANRGEAIDFFKLDKKRKAENERMPSIKKLATADSKIEFTAADRNKLKLKIFELFGTNEKQLLKDIVVHCMHIMPNSREKDVRELLEEYANYHKKGKFKYYWELKPEYKDYSNAMGSDDEQGSGNGNR